MNTQETCVNATRGKRVIYLSGPMKGYPERNYPLFHRVTADLRAQGHTVYNPAEYDHDEEVFPLRKAFAEYCAFILNQSDMLVMLPGWMGSRGATTERTLADMCGIEIVEWVDT